MFRIFDPSGIIGVSWNWGSRLLVLSLFWSNYWIASNKLFILLRNLFSILVKEFTAVFGILNFPGRVFLSVSLFFYILLNNFCGLFPYIFTSSSHGSFTLALALPLWVGHMFIAFVLNFEVRIAHFVPLRTPGVLIPFMVLIEFIRRVIRPFTLAVRLAANIIAGHLLLSLLREKMTAGRFIVGVLVLTGLLALLILELAVRVIQAYVFRLLSTLYLNEVNSQTFFCLNNVYNILDFLSKKEVFLWAKNNKYLFWK